MKKIVLLAFMIILFVIPVYFWSRILAPDLPWKNYFYDAGRILGILGFVFMTYQFIISSRIRFIERGIGLDKFFGIHRLFGKVGFIFILCHPALLYISGYSGALFSLLKLLGIVAFLLISIAALLAIFYVKLGIKYEIWKNFHFLNYVVFPLSFIHSFRLGSDLHNWYLRFVWLFMAFIFVAIILHKLWKVIYVRKHPFKIKSIVQETYDTWSLYLDGKHKSYSPGQFMFIRLKRNGKTSEPHPFTISSSPTRDLLSVSIKSVGDFTSTIEQTKTSDLAFIDAPYGIFSFFNYDANDLVFIAGGIGITPFMSMLRYIYDKKLDKNITLIWGNKTEKDIVFREELEKMTKDMPKLNIIHVMSKQTDWPGEKGYLDINILKKYIKNIQNSQFFICGPPIMMDIVIKALKSMGVSKNKIHFERFALS